MHWICTRVADDTNLWLTQHRTGERAGQLLQEDEDVEEEDDGKGSKLCKRKCHQRMALIQRLSVRRLAASSLETVQLYSPGQVLPKAGQVVVWLVSS